MGTGVGMGVQTTRVPKPPRREGPTEGDECAGKGGRGRVFALVTLAMMADRGATKGQPTHGPFGFDCSCNCVRETGQAARSKAKALPGSVGGGCKLRCGDDWGLWGRTPAKRQWQKMYCYQQAVLDTYAAGIVGTILHATGSAVDWWEHAEARPTAGDGTGDRGGALP